jgi:hypothetical protein
MTMNTRLSYRYADRTNCRQYTSIVVAGTITWEQIAPYLAKQGSFIPGQLGLEDLQNRFALPGGDHPWHQIMAEDIRPTEAAPTIALTGGELADRFGHTPWQVDWLATNAALKVNVPEPTMSVDVSLHSYAPDKELMRMRAARHVARKTTTRAKVGNDNDSVQ